MGDSKPTHVVIVGAGLAGLTTAELLVAAGVDVVVLEAGSRVGGRTFTRRDVFTDDRHAEAGAEWIDTVHHRVHRLAARFGLAVDPVTTTWTAVRRWLYRDGRLLGPDDLQAIDPEFLTDLDRLEDFVAGIVAGIADPAHPDRHPDAARFDALSVADVVEQLGLGALARLFAQRNMEGEFAAEPTEVSALFIAQQRAVYAAAEASHGHVEAQRLLGGVGALSDGLAATLPDGVVHLAEPAVSIAVVDGRAVVRTAVATYDADAVVVACTLPAARRIEFDPPLAAAVADAVAGLGYGTVTKTALQYPSRVWPAGYATSAGPVQRVYEPTAAMPGDTGILMAYTGGDGGRALGALSELERMDAMERGEREMYPDLPPRLGGFSQAWSAEPSFGGSYAVYRPGEIGRFWSALREPVGCIHLAGEHTATWTGYLEGAIESGETVAARLLGTD
ncbi:MAG: Amine oxidase [Ilumatobacteraceae bacterium]|nr:Amine oxidase [Ilumatobacteraceae bacterium]